MANTSGEAIPRTGDERRPAQEKGVGQKPPRVFYRTLREFLRQLPGRAQRFWVLVFATGAVAGLGAVLLFALLRFVERRAWFASESFLSAVQSASPLRRVLVPALAGLLISAVSLLARWPVGGHGTAGILEAVWLRRGRLALGRALARGALSIVAVGMGRRSDGKEHSYRREQRPDHGWRVVSGSPRARRGSWWRAVPRPGSPPPTTFPSAGRSSASK